ACARAFLTASGSLTTIIVSYQHLSLNMLSSREQVSKLSAVRSVLSLIDTDYILFEASGHCTTLDIFRKLPSQLEVTRFDQFLDKLDTDTSSVISVSDFISENISTIVNCGNAQLKKIDIQINPVVSQVFDESLQKTPFEESYSRNPRLLKGLMLHVTNRINQIEESGDSGTGMKIESSRDLVEETIRIADSISEKLESIFHISIQETDRYFIALYLTIAGKWDQKEMVPLLIIAHGKSIATQQKEYLDDIYKDQIPISAINYIPDMQMNDLLELVTIRCNELDHGQGIIIAADGSPFENISDYIVSTLHIRCRCIKCSSLDGLMKIADRISRYQSLEQIMLNIGVENSTPSSPSPQPVSSGNQSIIFRLTNEFLQPSLTFLYASKAVDALMISLSGILEDLHLSYSNELAIKFLCHSVNMLERVIRVEPLPYPKVNSFIRSNLKVYQVIEKNLQNVNELYGISIPKEEIAYITEIILEPLNAESAS
ncbi:MAG: PRD domain-containing protein, partial [Bulleidia sp.]